MRIVKDICAGCPLLIHGTCHWEPGDPCKITDMSARFRETAVAVRATADRLRETTVAVRSLADTLREAAEAAHPSTN